MRDRYVLRIGNQQNSILFSYMYCFPIPEWTEYGLLIMRIVFCWNNFWFTRNSQIVLFIDLCSFTQRIKEKALKFHLPRCIATPKQSKPNNQNSAKRMHPKFLESVLGILQLGYTMIYPSSNAFM